MSATEERHFEWAVMLNNDVIIEEDKPFTSEGEALKLLQRERQHLSAYGVPEEFFPVLIRREIVLSTGSWLVMGD